MKKVNILIAAATLTTAIYLSSCKSKKNAAASGCTTTPTFTADIKPILDQYCGKTCHSAEKHRHNIDLSTYALSKSAAANKNFLGSIKHEQGYDAMPMKADKLPDATIEKIACWVNGGMPE